MRVVITSRRFGELQVQPEERVHFPFGLLGFAELKDFVLVDPGDDTLILWLQSVSKPEVALPVLEPKIFHSSYLVRLSAVERRELGLESLQDASVLCVLTIPADIQQMTANLKAPLVIHRKTGIGRQVILQENEYGLKHPLFKDLRAHLMTIQAQNNPTTVSTGLTAGPMDRTTLRVSDQIRSLVEG